MRAVSVLCFIMSGLALGGAVMAVMNSGRLGDIAYQFGALMPAAFFLCIGLVLNHFASKRAAIKLQKPK